MSWYGKPWWWLVYIFLKFCLLLFLFVPQNACMLFYIPTRILFSQLLNTGMEYEKLTVMLQQKSQQHRLLFFKGFFCILPFLNDRKLFFSASEISPGLLKLGLYIFMYIPILCLIINSISITICTIKYNL